MRQSLSDPSLAVPFLSTVALGVLGLALGVGFARWRGRRADTEGERLAARVGGAGLGGIGVAAVAFGLSYTGTQARLLVTADPSLLGRLGLALPWVAIGGGLLVLSFVAVFVTLGLEIRAEMATGE